MSQDRYPRGNDLQSVRGYKAILISCDNAKEREAVKESMNLINQTIEAIYKDQEPSTQLNGIIAHLFVLSEFICLLVYLLIRKYTRIIYCGNITE